MHLAERGHHVLARAVDDLGACRRLDGAGRAHLDDAPVADDEGLSLEHPLAIHRNDVDADQRQDRRLPAHGNAEGHDRRDARGDPISAVEIRMREKYNA